MTPTRPATLTLGNAPPVHGDLASLLARVRALWPTARLFAREPIAAMEWTRLHGNGRSYYVSVRSERITGAIIIGAVNLSGRPRTHGPVQRTEWEGRNG